MQKKSGGTKPNTRLTMTAILLFIAVLALIVGISVSYAVYTRSRNAQRALGVYDEAKSAFSSNYLLDVADSSENIRTIYVDDVRYVSVHNYAQNNPGKVYGSDFTYTLTAAVYKKSGSNYVTATAADLGEHTITVTKNGGGTITLSSANLNDSLGGSFYGGIPASNSYLIEFGEGFIDGAPDLYVELVATPAVETQLPTLRGLFRPDTKDSSGWTGEFEFGRPLADLTGDGYGFNYVIMGLGSGECTLTWNSDKLSLSEFMLDCPAVLDGEGVEITEAGSYSSVTFAVDAESQNRYELVFFRADGFGNAETLQSVASYVTLSYDPSP